MVAGRKLAYRKTYRTVVPMDRSEMVDEDVLVWLTRESFDRAAAADALVLTAFTVGGEINPQDIPPKVEKQMGRPTTDFVWRAFEGVGERA